MDGTAARVRRLGSGDGAAARALIAASGDAAALAPLRSALERALEGAGGADAPRALAADDDAGLAAVVVYGFVAGAVGAARLQGCCTAPRARRRGLALTLGQAALAELTRDGARLAVAEVADDETTADARRLLARLEFREEARVADYVRDGVALLILRRDLG